MKVGDRVVCINSKSNIGNTFLIEGKEYVCGSNPYQDPVDGKTVIDIIGEFTRGKQVRRFRLIDEQNFTNALTRKLANEAMKELKEYVPLTIEI